MKYLHWIHIWSIHYRAPAEHFCEELSDGAAASQYKCRPAENLIVWSSSGSVVVINPGLVAALQTRAARPCWPGRPNTAQAATLQTLGVNRTLWARISRLNKIGVGKTK